MLLFGAVALAHNTPVDVKVESFKMDIVLVDSTFGAIAYKQIAPATEMEVARLYRSKFSRVKKALEFSTKFNQAKLS